MSTNDWAHIDAYIGDHLVPPMMSSESRVTANVVQTAGSKGPDGFAIARVIQA